MINKESINKMILDNYVLFKKMDKKQMINRLTNYYVLGYAMTLHHASENTNSDEERKEYRDAINYIERLTNVERVDFNEFVKKISNVEELSLIEEAK